MTELYELPTPAAGRVGICRNAIEEALKMGFSMNDCARRLGLNYKTFWQAWKEARIVVPQEKQVALPAPAAPQECFRMAHSSSSSKESVVTEQGQESPDKPKKVLPRIGGNGQKTEREMTAAERVIANIPHI